MTIPVIDLFAGPCGLGEGFSAFSNGNKGSFRISLSVEKDPYAYNTLELRSFFRKFPSGAVPEKYYELLRGEISREELFQRYPEQAALVNKEVY